MLKTFFRIFFEPLTRHFRQNPRSNRDCQKACAVDNGMRQANTTTPTPPDGSEGVSTMKKTVTRVAMIEAAIKAFELLESENLLPEITALPASEYVEVAQKMLASLSKKPEKKPSKAALDNERLAHEVALVMPEGEPVLTSWIMEHCKGITTPQKATVVMRVLIEKGRVEKVPNFQKGYVGYKLI